MGLNHSPRIITDGLVLCLDAANTKSYPGSGTTFTDLSGRGNNGTLTNGASFSSSFGGIITTDGIDDFILTPQITGTGSGTLSQSYCLWVRPNDTDGNIMSMSSGNPQSSWNMPPIAASSSKFRGKFWSNNYLNALSTYTNGVWYYLSLVFSYNATQANAFQRFYVNGVLQAEQTNITYSSSGVNNFIFFGQQNPGADNTGMFAGSYGSIQIYTGKALTQAEILQNFNTLRGRYGI
jgi:hypothetical protein